MEILTSKEALDLYKKPNGDKGVSLYYMPSIFRNTPPLLGSAF